MKPYLNKEEQQQLAFINCLANELEFMVANWKERDNLTEAEEAKLRETVKAADEALGTILGRLGPEQAQRIARCVKGNMVIMKPRLSSYAMRAMLERDAAENNEAGAFCSLDTAYCLANYALSGHCHPCKLTPEERKSCPARAAFIELDIPMCDEHATGDICPYDNGEVAERDPEQMRKRLVEIIAEAKKIDYGTGGFDEWLADFLIGYGVTVPEG